MGLQDQSLQFHKKNVAVKSFVGSKYLSSWIPCRYRSSRLDLWLLEQISSPSYSTERGRNKGSFLLHFSALEHADWIVSVPCSASVFQSAIVTSFVELVFRSQLPCRQHQAISFSPSMSLILAGDKSTTASLCSLPLVCSWCWFRLCWDSLAVFQARPRLLILLPVSA